MSIDFLEAQKHFQTTDETMVRLLNDALQAQTPLVAPSPKKPTHYFASIVASITSQQISIKAADAVLGRVKKAVGTITPERVNAIDFDTLKACGLSGQKTKYIKHNAEVWHTLPIKNFAQMDDEAVIAELVKLYGIGRWTAEMFLMFSLARPDVFSRGDLGLMQGLFAQYPVKPHHTRKINTIIDTWSPHRTTASLVLWFHKDTSERRGQNE